MKKKFICTVCGYIHEGTEAPEKCPICKAPASKFNEMSIEDTPEFATVHKLGDGKLPGSDEEMMSYDEESSGESASKYFFYIELEDDEGLMMGQHVYLEPDLGQEDTGTAEGIWLDEWYVDESDENAPFVWVDDGEGKLVKRDVIIGERDTEMGTLQILSGLELTDLIAFPDVNCSEGAKTEKAEYTTGGADGGYTGEEEGYVPSEDYTGQGEDYVPTEGGPVEDTL